MSSILIYSTLIVLATWLAMYGVFSFINSLYTPPSTYDDMDEDDYVGSIRARYKTLEQRGLEVRALDFHDNAPLEK